MKYLTSFCHTWHIFVSLYQNTGGKHLWWTLLVATRRGLSTRRPGLPVINGAATSSKNSAFCALNIILRWKKSRNKNLILFLEIYFSILKFLDVYNFQICQIHQFILDKLVYLKCITSTLLRLYWLRSCKTRFH